MIFTLSNYEGILNLTILLCLAIGGFFAFRNGKREGLVKLQKETNDALQQHIEALERKMADVEKQNHLQQHIIDTIIAALKQKNMHITVDGDMIIISDPSGSSYKKMTTTTTNSTTGSKVVQEES